MKETRFHYEENTKKQETLLLFLFFVFTFYGLYKNGLSYYWIGKMSFIEAIKPLLFPINGVFLTILWDSIFSKKLKITKKNIFFGILIGLLMPTRFPIWLYVILSFIFLFLFPIAKKKIPTFSFLCCFKVIVILFTNILDIGLENSVEHTIPYLYGIIDTFFGRSIGSFGTTSIFLILILFGILSMSFYYKKELPIYTYVTYLFLFFICFFLFPNQYQMKDILNSSLLFLAVVFVPENETSPATLNLQRGYGILIGFLSFILIHFFHIEEGAYISLLLINIIWNILFFFYKRKFDKIF